MTDYVLSVEQIKNEKKKCILHKEIKMKTKSSRLTALSIVALFVVVTVLSSVLVACDKNNKDVFDNENDPLVFSTQAVDKVFNPFFSTSATDSNVVGMTQMSMLGNDKAGEVTYGDDEDVITKDLQIVSNGVGEEQTTTYYFVLKNNVKFSNGSALTIKDVLFNLYVYLDPAYTGSSTIYSTEIVGLAEYRTQQSSEKEQESFKQQFEIKAQERTDALLDACATILDEHSGEYITEAKFLEYLEEYKSTGENFAHIVEDYNKALELFNEELNNDYSNSKDSYQDIVFSDKDGNIYKNLFTTDVEVFLYNEGYITWSKKDARLTSTLATDVASLKNWTQDQAISAIVSDKIPKAIDEILTYWNTSVTLNDYLVNAAMEEYFQQNSEGRRYKNISGIKFANRTESVVVNGKTYPAVQYDQSGGVADGYNEVLSITIKKVDPKAIWNFALSIAPMYYYSSSDWNRKNYIESFDYESNFGVEYGSQSFMNEVVKAPEKVGVPVGAGAYAASRASGGIDNVTSAEFYNLGVIYYERNPYFLMGPAKIKKVRFQVVSTTQTLNSLYNKEVDYAEPNAKPETINELNAKKSEGIGNKSIQTSGYGYIGINAGKVPSIVVRQVIMHSINTQECVNYYKTTAKAIYRSMSMSNWAYPGYGAGMYGTKAPTPYYPYIGGKIPEDLSVVNPRYAQFVYAKGKSAGDTFTEAEQDEFINTLLDEAGYAKDGNGIYYKGNDKLVYTFTIAGEETDHPAFNALLHASEILNRNGFQITVKTDSNALKKLSTGELTVWAAAWGSTIDPDMYQVYHKDSKATSVLNWGYKQILLNPGGKYDVENELLNELSELIEQGRQTEDKARRAQIYSDALDIVMQMAIELPTYQRDDLFAYNTNKIDVSTFTPDNMLSPYKGLTSNIWNLSLNTER